MKAVNTQNLNPRVDAYLDQAPAFALPILIHLRKLMRGAILCNMSAFSQHCSFGFWGEEMGAVLREAEVLRQGGMGSLGRITSLQDLPSDKLMLQCIHQASAFVESGQHTSPIAARRKVVKARNPNPAAPPEFQNALERNREAAAAFAALNLSCKREYIEWISEAKRAATRDRRITTAIQWITEGKPLNWKYQSYS